MDAFETVVFMLLVGLFALIIVVADREDHARKVAIVQGCEVVETDLVEDTVALRCTDGSMVRMNRGEYDRTQVSP